jgi:hypothetical protein
VCELCGSKKTEEKEGNIFFLSHVIDLCCFMIVKVGGNGYWGSTGIVFGATDEGIRLRVRKKHGFCENL